MRHLYLAAALTLALATSATATESGAPMPSVLRLDVADADGGEGTCSVAVIAPGVAVTAAHCVDGTDLDFTVDGRSATVAVKNRILDLAVVKFPARSTDTPVQFAPSSPKVGAEVVAKGFAFAKKDVHAQYGRVACQKDEDGYLVSDLTLIFGDSGGPLFDAKGRLVGVNVAIQFQGPARLALAVPVETVLEFVREYLPKVAVK
jgi:S1-C subfamily serine protease